MTTGTFSGTLAGTLAASALASITLDSSVNFPTKVSDRTIFYQLLKNSSSPLDSYGFYSASPNIGNQNTYTTGVAPKGFASIVDMYYWFITATGGTNTYDGNLAYHISNSGASYSTHAAANYFLFSVSSGPDIMRRTSAMAIGGDPAIYFENVIAENDVFGLQVNSSCGKDHRALGISITWRF